PWRWALPALPASASASSRRRRTSPSAGTCRSASSRPWTPKRATCSSPAGSTPSAACAATGAEMQPSPRQNEILALARAQGRVSVEELAARFSVTPQTIRKDLNDLCDQRLLSRIHGGAILGSGVENMAYEARRLIAAEEKRAIGLAAAA